MASLVSKYAPTTFEDVAGQSEAVAKLRQLESRGWDGRVLWITGKSGTGKSTLARLVAASAASDPCCVETINAQDLSLDRCRELDRQCRFAPVWGGVHAIVVNEAHRLRGPVMSYLNDVLEAPHVVRNSCWIFTTTLDGELKLFDEDEIERVPFGSRTIPLRLKYDEGVTLEFALRCQKIAKAEGLDGKDLTDYVALVRKHNWNMRECLNAIDAGEMLPPVTQRKAG
jgi:energy-coupling factor transporter ATP-binding protein EcfA2